MTLAEGLAGTGRNAGGRETERESERERTDLQRAAHIYTLLTRVHFYLLPSPNVTKTSDSPHGKFLFIETAGRGSGRKKSSLEVTVVGVNKRVSRRNC